MSLAPGMIRCRWCATEWSGLGRAHCSGCHATFSTAGTFDRHRRAGSCQPPVDRGLVQRHGLWGYPQPEQDFRA